MALVVEKGQLNRAVVIDQEFHPRIDAGDDATSVGAAFLFLLIIVVGFFSFVVVGIFAFMRMTVISGCVFLRFRGTANEKEGSDCGSGRDEL